MSWWKFWQPKNVWETDPGWLRATAADLDTEADGRGEDNAVKRGRERSAKLYELRETAKAMRLRALEIEGLSPHRLKRDQQDHWRKKRNE